MLKILTFGVYDMLHIGHILLFKHIKEYFPDQECKLIVAVQDGDCILKYKPGTKMVYSTDTVYNPNIIGEPKFQTVSVAPMFAETIMRYYNYESINAMFTRLPEKVVQAGFRFTGLEI